MEKTTKESKLVDAISERLLKEDAPKFASIKEILNAPVTILKKVDDRIAAVLEESAFITTVGELVSLDPANPFQSILEGSGETDDPIRFSLMKDTLLKKLENVVSEDLMRDIIIAAQLIHRAQKKQDFYIKKKREKKIMFLGLDNAGKTAIISVMSGKTNLAAISRLRPTKRVKREKITTKDFEIYIWDMGGQKEYRNTYLDEKNLEMFFLRVDMIVYVIDMQDPARYDESLSYLKGILETLEYLKEDPYILFFLHKSDPDIINEPEFQINMAALKEKLGNLLKPYKFEYNAYPTSIHYLYSRGSGKFSKFIKDVLNEQKQEKIDKKDPIKAMGEILDTAMNLTINLANSVQEEFENVNNILYNVQQRLQRIEGIINTQVLHHPATSSPVLAREPKPIQSGSSAYRGQSIELPAGAVSDLAHAAGKINVPPTPRSNALQPEKPVQQPVVAFQFSPPAPPPPLPPIISSTRSNQQHQCLRTTIMDELKEIFAKKRLA
ncbi:MAG: ADP-ribosylation factor-like protein [Promethearchaeota archaeon]